MGDERPAGHVVTVWFLLGTTVNVVRIPCDGADTQIRDSGVGLVVLRDAAGEWAGSHTFQDCKRIDHTPKEETGGSA